MLKCEINLLPPRARVAGIQTGGSREIVSKPWMRHVGVDAAVVQLERPKRRAAIAAPIRPIRAKCVQPLALGNAKRDARINP
jgi:hypothetical protein